DLDLRLTVRSPLLVAPVALTLADLPDRQRLAIGAALRGDALSRLLDEGEHAAVRRGEELRPVIRRALARRVRELTHDAADPARRDVVELLAILEELGQAVPFEVQTVFYRLWQQGEADEPGMVELARRMGFAPPRRTLDGRG
ncbi:MAG TPA: hypothetical protein VEI47_03105, partial [Gemmatimonadales bacterium]|nr:hypothetical protein [Gemmatimonadales bacterium]